MLTFITLGYGILVKKNTLENRSHTKYFNLAVIPGDPSPVNVLKSVFKRFPLRLLLSLFYQNQRNSQIHIL